MRISKNFGKFAWLIALSLAFLVRPASGEVATHPLKGVTRIHFKLPGELEVRYGAEEKLVVEAPADVMSKLDISTKGDTLVLAARKSFKSDQELKFKVTLKALRALKSDGSGKVELANFSGSDIDIEAAGSGGMALKDVKPGRLAVVIKGASDVSVSGSGKSLLARIDGTGSIDAADFRVRQADAVINGSGEIQVYAEESLKAVINGAGNIGYKGKAKVTQSVSGAGSIDRI